MTNSPCFWHFRLHFGHSLKRSSNNSNSSFLPSRLVSLLLLAWLNSADDVWGLCLGCNAFDCFSDFVDSVAQFWVLSLWCLFNHSHCVVGWSMYCHVLWLRLMLRHWVTLTLNSSCEKVRDVVFLDIMSCHHVMSVRLPVVVRYQYWKFTILEVFNILNCECHHFRSDRRSNLFG